MTKRGLNGVIKFYDKITIGLVLASVAAYVAKTQLEADPPVPSSSAHKDASK